MLLSSPVVAEQTSNTADANKMASSQTSSRDNPIATRRPASYIGGSLSYAQLRTWLAETDDHRKLSFGPLHSVANVFRVGDAFTDKFALGFQIQFFNAKKEKEQISAFALLLDATFYPWRGLGIRPAAGFGFGFAQGENKWEFGFGGPGTLSLALTYEFQISRKFTLAPIVQGTWMAGDDYDGLFVSIGIEMLFWLSNKNRHDK